MKIKLWWNILLTALPFILTGTLYCFLPDQTATHMNFGPKGLIFLLPLVIAIYSCVDISIFLTKKKGLP